jgi:hypothetical protein
VTHLGAAFDVPADLPVDEDYLAFACGGNPAPGVFLGVGYGFCPFSQLQNEPPGPSIYVGPYYQEADESRRELTSPTPLPDDVRPRPGAEIIEEQGQLVRWVTADSTVFPELNLEFRFVGVDDDLRSAVVGSVTPTR